MQNGFSMPEAKYERNQILSLEASAEVLQDVKLLRDVHEWEKTASKSDRESIGKAEQSHEKSLQRLQ